ncbi:hypothetical protein RESH_05734 [Rhodopirellula europaea SH398]|uniref:Uncharacterized protein n=1 Tax=Rhodopirellula europaea SH398 TaxID=1263868 RepID=M5RWE7_9BACT|nr:hypothetical protein RESH_05734 [Rhodopirellula europaea SH398]
MGCGAFEIPEERNERLRAKSLLPTSCELNPHPPRKMENCFGMVAGTLVAL